MRRNYTGDQGVFIRGKQRVIGAVTIETEVSVIGRRHELRNVRSF